VHLPIAKWHVCLVLPAFDLQRRLPAVTNYFRLLKVPHLALI
jgi:hypothetical protein